jgi:hypothetical protein
MQQVDFTWTTAPNSLHNTHKLSPWLPTTQFIYAPYLSQVISAPYLAPFEYGPWRLYVDSDDLAHDINETFKLHIISHSIYK